MLEQFQLLTEDHPRLTTWTLILVNLYLLLVLMAAVKAKRPGKRARQVPASEVAVYKKGDPVSFVETNAKGIVRLAQTGIASTPPATLCQMFKAAAEAFPSAPALKCERDGWQTWSWAAYYAQSMGVAKALLSDSIGFAAHDCVNVIGFNSPEWFMAQMGAILAGGKAAGVYTTNEPAACSYQASHSEAKVIFVEDAKQLTKYLGFKEELSTLKSLVQWSGAVPAGVSGRVRAMSWSGFLELGASVPESTVQQRMDAVEPGHVATLIYTSGTTGNPKAVMISHDNIVYESLACLDQLFSGVMFTGSVPSELRIVSYLPLSHVAAQMLDICSPIVVTACGRRFGLEAFTSTYYTTWFADPNALKGTLPKTLAAARPTLFLGVPRVWEKIREKLLEVGKQTKGPAKALSTFAKKHAAMASKARQLGGNGKVTVGYVLTAWVLKLIKKKLGLDQCVACLTAAAPMPAEVSAYFASLDIDLLDVYGMSESSGAQTCSTAMVHQAGTVGPAIGPAETRIDHVQGRDKPGEGEICYRGRHIMLGYMKDAAKTAEAIDTDGWLHSGDVGMLDPDGLLHITGRIKELIITAGGENIAPVPIEDKLKELLPAISNVMMVGDKRKYNVCILTVKTAIDPDTGLSNGQLAGDALSVSSATTDAEAVAESQAKGSKWQAYLTTGMEVYNRKHTVSNAQKIQKFAVVPGDFSEKGGELTATLKLKRSVTADKYAATIEAMY